MIGIIGGSGLQSINLLQDKKKQVIRTPFGIPSAPIISGRLNGQEVAFLARHGLQYTIPPHLINYRANIWALHHIGCQEVAAFSLMCSINADIGVGEIIIPDQLIDYTWDRKSTFLSSHTSAAVHYTEFAEPYADVTRAKLTALASKLDCVYKDKATYGITQGPRYETRAEVRRYQIDGCDLLGMTGMPEAALAQEIGLQYAVCGLVTNVYCATDSKSRERLDGDSQEVFEAILQNLA